MHILIYRYLLFLTLIHSVINKRDMAAKYKGYYILEKIFDASVIHYDDRLIPYFNVDDSNDDYLTNSDVTTIKMSKENDNNASSTKNDKTDSMNNEDISNNSSNKDDVTNDSLNKQDVNHDSLNNKDVSRDSSNKTYVANDNLNNKDVTTDSTNKQHVTHDSLNNKNITTVSLNEKDTRGDLSKNKNVTDSLNNKDITNDSSNISNGNEKDVNIGTKSLKAPEDKQTTRIYNIEDLNKTSTIYRLALSLINNTKGPRKNKTSNKTDILDNSRPNRRQNVNDKLNELMNKLSGGEQRDEIFYQPYWEGGEEMFMRTGTKQRANYRRPIDAYRDCDRTCSFFEDKWYGRVCAERRDSFTIDLIHRNFSSLCAMEAANCADPKKRWYPVHRGPCAYSNKPYDFLSTFDENYGPCTKRYFTRAQVWEDRYFGAGRGRNENQNRPREPIGKK